MENDLLNMNDNYVLVIKMQLTRRDFLRYGSGILAVLSSASIIDGILKTESAHEEASKRYPLEKRAYYELNAISQEISISIEELKIGHQTRSKQLLDDALIRYQKISNITGENDIPVILETVSNHLPVDAKPEEGVSSYDFYSRLFGNDINLLESAVNQSRSLRTHFDSIYSAEVEHNLDKAPLEFGLGFIGGVVAFLAYHASKEETSKK